ncbi:hypothetical protein SAMN05216249_12620 [Acetitomaculum ruminis DSM 5522]|uniref:Uncharacterized protein n=1 Tax=Acetitomaculum ruminis DSM 5522 TaxID=1120918 RepID=A0A1I1AF57_9FIRM|nr:DUF6033 family protein [Acetitomaculum ruminis]SFB36655.1 hypothetical protein SAMN05216249_12620 [Acetitomaculum ruminis DSM 5522]
MAGFSGIAAYQQTNQTYYAKNKATERTKTPASKSDKTDSTSGNSDSKVEIKSWSPIDTESLLVPRQTDYGNTIGDVKLSDKAADYLNKLKSKFHNMEFITVSEDMKAQVQQNAAAYGNSSKMVVLINEEKLERMATDESFRKKYEGIIAMSQSKMETAKNSLTSSGASIKNFGMSVDSDGNESFFATVEKSQDLQKERIEKKAAQKKEEKAKEKKKAEKKAREERIEKAKDKKAKSEDIKDTKETEKIDDKEYLSFEADSLDDLLSKVREYSYDISASKVMTDTEKMLGGRVDYMG